MKLTKKNRVEINTIEAYEAKSSCICSYNCKCRCSTASLKSSNLKNILAKLNHTSTVTNLSA